MRILSIIWHATFFVSACISFYLLCYNLFSFFYVFIIGSKVYILIPFGDFFLWDIEQQ